MNNPLEIETSFDNIPPYEIKINRILCLQTEDVTGRDDIYLEYWWDAGGKTRYPPGRRATKKINTNQSWNLDQTIKADGGVTIVLYEWDIERDDPFSHVSISEYRNIGMTVEGIFLSFQLMYQQTGNRLLHSLGTLDEGFTNIFLQYYRKQINFLAL